MGVVCPYNRAAKERGSKGREADPKEDGENYIILREWSREQTSKPMLENG